MDVVDFFSDGFQKLKDKPLVWVTNSVTWLVILVFTAILISNVTSFEHALTFSFFNVGALIVAYYTNIYFVNRFIETQQYLVYILLLIALMVSITCIRFAVNSFYLSQYLKSYPISASWKYLFSGASTLMVLAISLFYGLLINRSRKEKEYQLIIFSQQQQQLNFLKAQISPHFLFNSLNNIYSLTIGKAPQATEMVLLLSDVLRYALYESKNEHVLLSNEIEQIKKMIVLNQLKSEKTLAITFTSSLSSPDVLIEPMILIPLVENCFKHGNIHHAPNAFISIVLEEKNGVIRVSLKNSTDAQSQHTRATGGIGLENIKQRLALLYPNRHSLTFTEETNTFAVVLEIDKRNG
ncbi:MAG: histidine kinase [Bacteroidetes bacterium]|nr:histidine kinase [Bacteroidota bacterium]